MILLEQLRKPEEVKRWFDQIGDQAANEIESLQQQLIAARQSKNACVIDLYRRLDLLDDLNQDLQTQLAKAKRTIQKMKEALRDIAAYGKDHDGCCPYGCDTPYIAQQTLADRELSI